MHLFNELSYQCSQSVTMAYSTSFYSSVSMLDPIIQDDIHNIYGFVRFADEIVDTFLEYDQEYLLNRFESDLYEALGMGISLNPILNSFQKTVHKYGIDLELIKAFMKSMRMDLTKKEYTSQDDYEEYIYGSADVVGLMCLKVFVGGDDSEYHRLKPSAMKLGSAFQKVNFLRDLKSDTEVLNRSYFPNVDLNNLTSETKQQIIDEIERDFEAAYKGIVQLPDTARFGVYTAYKYYRQLLKKLKRTPSNKIMEARIRVRDHVKLGLLVKSYVNVKLQLL
ncbi:MAG: phytoene/squalene synthase family protein [Bacteroidia bacterium]|nr:phytoene/squalene synthase family protein [Bacteroidia bacterium]